MPPLPPIIPPLLNSASLWASTPADLIALYTSPYTGAITTRTASDPLNSSSSPGLPTTQHAFSTPSHRILPPPPPSKPELETTHPAPQTRNDLTYISSLNTYAYSPASLLSYIQTAKSLRYSHAQIRKPIIFSVAGNAETVARCWSLLTKHHDDAASQQWCLEINLSCPNIPGKPPPAYEKRGLTQFLAELREHISRAVWEGAVGVNRQVEDRPGHWRRTCEKLCIPIGVKLPPYTYAGQFDDVVEVLRKFNSEGFGVITTDSRADYTARDKPETAAAGNMTTTAIDPTLLSSADVDNYVAELAGDMASKLSLSAALDNSSNGYGQRHSEGQNEGDPTTAKPFAESFPELLKSPFGSALRTHAFGSPWPIAFVTATNTLGSSLLMTEPELHDESQPHKPWNPALSGPSHGIGGLAGAALHPLALGNVANLRRRLGRRGDGSDIKIIGVGGVCDGAGYERMRDAGADVVGVATALGAMGVRLFQDILGVVRMRHEGDEAGRYDFLLGRIGAGDREDEMIDEDDD